MFSKVKESELANAVYNFKIEELTREIEISKSQKKVDPEMEGKYQELLSENEALKKRIKELEEALKKKDITTISHSELESKMKELEFKHRDALDRIKAEYEIKHKEVKSEVNVLQSSINKLNSEKGALEIQLLEVKRKITASDNSSGKITHKVSMNQSNNTFGVLLKKTEGGANKFLKEAQKEAKSTEQNLQELWKDKIDDLKKLRENIIRMSPKTVSTRSIPDEDYQNIDFEDEEAFKKMQEKLAKRDNKHKEERERLEKIKIEMELEAKK